MAEIEKLFPHCVTEIEDGTNPDGSPILKKGIDFDLLKQELSDHLVEGDRERYRLDWVGKKQAILTANAPIAKTLRPVRAESVNFDTTENLFIEGNNLDALKLLQKNYLGKIKMIYIDPPYNTGKDFIYQDNFSQNSDDYFTQSEQIDEDGNRLFSNTESNGRFHSDWLSMIYSRLRLSRNLLTDDGVIFISIDDNEQANLKRICDEYLGKNNFVGVYIKQSKVGGGNDAKHIVKEHEYCLIYTKNIDKLGNMFIEHSDEYLKRYKEQDENGKFFWDTFARPGLRNPIIYDIQAPDGTIIRNGWIRSKERFKKEYEEGKIRIIRKEDKSWSVQFKQYLNVLGKTPRSLTMDFGGNIEGDNDQKELFGKKYFSYPKSIKFISTLLSTINNKEAIILDFFAGSATTAHAVMQLNAEDGGKRKYIMVQLPEQTDEKSEAFKAGFANIAEISKERIRRAGQKIRADFKQADKTLPEHWDDGFRVLKIDSSNLHDIYYRPQETAQADLLAHADYIKPDRTSEDLLFQVMLDWGLDLALPIECREIEGVSVFLVGGNSLVACFEPLTEQIIAQIAKFEPMRFVSCERAIQNDADKANFIEQLKHLSSLADDEIKFI